MTTLRALRVRREGVRLRVHGELLIRHAQVKKLSWRGFCYARVPLSDLLMLFSLSGIHYLRSTAPFVSRPAGFRLYFETVIFTSFYPTVEPIREPTR